MSTIFDWLFTKSVSKFSSFSKQDLESDCRELLYVKGISIDDSLLVVEEKEKLWEHLQQWQFDKEYLASLDLHIIVAKHIRASAQILKCSDMLKDWKDNNIEVYGDLLAADLQRHIQQKMKTRAPYGRVHGTKIQDRFDLKPVDDFHTGLEQVIGYPCSSVDFVKAMKREHQPQNETQCETFVDSRGREIDPQVEWNIVVPEGEWSIAGVSCKTSYVPIPKREIGIDLSEFFAKEQYVAAGMNEAEVIGLRLWTGPMHEIYVQALRTEDTPQTAYTNTLHAINSGITKLSKKWRIPECRKVYRGYNRKLELDKFLDDGYGCRGGVERSFLATTEKFEVAVSYSDEGAFILEITVGQVNKGANIAWLSQFPHEEEILFNAFSNVEFLGSPQTLFADGKEGIQVYQVQISSNTKSKTLKQYFDLRKDLHLNMTDVLLKQALRMLKQKKQDSDCDLVKHLCDACEYQSNAIARKGDETTLAIFNEGTDEYIELVGDVIRFQRQSLYIVDMALQWFDKKEACPMNMMSLEYWQLEALRSAFNNYVPPKVETLVLERRIYVSVFHTDEVYLGAIPSCEEALAIGRLFSLNRRLRFFHMEVKDATAHFWQKLLFELQPSNCICVNGFTLSQYAVQSLQSLDFRYHDAKEVTMLVTALVYHPPIALEELRIWNCPMCCDGAETLGNAFRSLQNLVHLRLSDCKVSDRGCTGIAKALTSLIALQLLDLSHNLIGDNGALNLAPTLRMPALKILNLNNNNVEDEGASALAAALHDSTGIFGLDLIELKFNKITPTHWQRLPQSKIKSHLLAELRCDHSVNGLAWSPKGSMFVSGGGDRSSGLNEIFIWNAKTGRQKTRLEGHSSEVCSVAWSPDGWTVASGSADGTIIIWDVQSGKQKNQLKGHRGTVRSVAWRPMGSLIASGSDDRSIIIWDSASGVKKSVLITHDLCVTSVAWSSKGILASGSYDRTVVIWGSKELLLKGHSEEIWSVAWSPEGSMIASGSSDGTIILWNTQTGEQKMRLLESQMGCNPNWVNSVAWSPDGSMIASGSNESEITLWDSRTGKQKFALRGHSSSVHSVAWSRDGTRIVSGCLKSATSPVEIFIWDASLEMRKTQIKEPTSYVSSVALSFDGSLIVSGGKDQFNQPWLVVWDAKTGEKQFPLDAKTGEMFPLIEHKLTITSVDWSRENSMIASGSSDSMIIIWDAKTREIKYRFKDKSPVSFVAWNPDGSLIASGTIDGHLSIWDGKSQKPKLELKGHQSYVHSAAWSPEGSMIVSGGGWMTGGDPEIFIWDAMTGEPKYQLTGHTESVTSVAWSPDGSLIASGSFDYTVRIWDAKTGEERSNLKGHNSFVRSVAWGQGLMIASASADKSIIIWNARSGEQKTRLEGHTSGVTAVAWSHAGSTIVSGSRDGTIAIWDVEIGEDSQGRVKVHTSRVL